MKHLKNLCKAMLGICLCISLIANAADSVPVSVTKDDLSAQKELLQMQIDSKKELLQKDIESQNKRIEAFDKRIDDQANRFGDIGGAVDRFAVITGQISIAVAVLLVLLGFLGYVKVKSDAKQVAEKAAKDTAQQWFEENNKKLNARLEELESKAGDAIKNIDTHTQTVKESSDLAKAEIQSLQERMEQEILGQRSVLQQAAGSSVIEQQAEELKTRPEDSYSFDDWNTRAFAAYNENKMEDAIFYWEKAAGMSAAGALKTIQAMFNRGLMLAKLNRTEEAIVSYDALIQNFGETSEIELRKRVAGAMACKGFCLGQLKLNEEVIATSDLLIQKFAGASEVEIRENIAMGMCNKGIALAQLNRNEEAIAVFDSLIQKFDEASEAEIRIYVVRAMYNKNIALKILKRNEEVIKTSDALVQKFGELPDAEINELVARVMYDKGYAFAQLNSLSESIAAYDKLIQKFEETSDVKLCEQIAYAKNGKGFSLLCQAKAKWEQQEQAKDLLEQAKLLFNQSLDISPNKGFPQGNLAYTAWLLNDPVLAEQYFSEGLLAQEGGAEELYKGTLSDFDIYPIIPDQGFRELVERLWVEYQQKQKS